MPPCSIQLLAVAHSCRSWWYIWRPLQRQPPPSDSPATTFVLYRYLQPLLLLLFHLSLQNKFLSLTKFLKWYEDVRPLVPLLLLHTQIHILLASLIPTLLVLAFWTQISLITLLIINHFSLLYQLGLFASHYHGQWVCGLSTCWYCSPSSFFIT